MNSSWAGFKQDGFNASFDPTSWLGTLGDLSGDIIGTVQSTLHAPGIFDIVQCAWDGTWLDGNVTAFSEVLSGPGALFDNNDRGHYIPLCFCMNVKDKNGQVAQDFISIEEWVAYCNGATPLIDCGDSSCTPSNDRN